MSRVATYSGPFLRGMGDIYDPVTGDYVASLPQSDNPYSLPLAPDQATFNSNPYAYSGIAEGGAAGDSAANYQAATGYAPNHIAPATGIPNVPYPSPRVSVPLSTSTVGMWLGNSNTVGGMPNWLLIGGVVVLGALVLGGSSSRRRR